MAQHTDVLAEYSRRRAIFGSTANILDLWSRLQEISLLLRLHDDQSRPHS